MSLKKNFATEAATHDWVLVVDCDERLSPDLAAEMTAGKPNLGRVLGYTVPRELAARDMFAKWSAHDGVRSAATGPRDVSEALRCEARIPGRVPRFVVSVLSGGEAFVRYTKLWYMQRAQPQAPAVKPDTRCC